MGTHVGPKEPRDGVIFGGKYRLSRMLGEGGMGAVWLATHTTLEMPCAVKFIRDDASLKNDFRSRFESEAKAAASLDGHPNVVRIFDYGIDGNIPYIAMEYLRGETLHERMKREKRFSVEATRDILREITEGLGAAHKRKVIHRDLKPQNIFLAQIHGKETVKILDFGIAKILGDAAETKTNNVRGTFAYLSPEHIACRGIDSRVDLWSLGIILFECLTGQSPHVTDNNIGIVTSIATRTGPAWNAYARAQDLPPAIDNFFMRAFAYEKEHRFQSASEMESAFKAVIDGRGGAILGTTTVLLPERLSVASPAEAEATGTDPSLYDNTTQPRLAAADRMQVLPPPDSNQIVTRMYDRRIEAFAAQEGEEIKQDVLPGSAPQDPLVSLTDDVDPSEAVTGYRPAPPALVPLITPLITPITQEEVTRPYVQRPPEPAQLQEKAPSRNLVPTSASIRPRALAAEATPERPASRLRVYALLLAGLSCTIALVFFLIKGLSNASNDGGEREAPSPPQAGPTVSASPPSPLPSSSAATSAPQANTASTTNAAAPARPAGSAAPPSTSAPPQRPSPPTTTPTPAPPPAEVPRSFPGNPAGRPAQRPDIGE